MLLSLRLSKEMHLSNIHKAIKGIATYEAERDSGNAIITDLITI